MSTTTYITLDGNGDEIALAAEAQGPVLTLHSVPEVSGSPVTVENPMPTQSVSGAVTPTGGDAFEVVTGGTAVIAFSADSIVNGAYITNPPTAAQPIFLDPVNVPGTTDPGTFGTTTRLYPGQTWTSPGPLTTAVGVNAPDSTHPFTAVRY